MTAEEAGGSGGPVPVRDLLKQMHPEPEVPADAAEEPEREPAEHVFETEQGRWLVRSAGAGAYGTGRLGAARVVAVHFYRQTDLETPVREALVPAGRFPHLREEELRELFEKATPIDVDR